MNYFDGDEKLNDSRQNHKFVEHQSVSIIVRRETRGPKAVSDLK